MENMPRRVCESFSANEAVQLHCLRSTVSLFFTTNSLGTSRSYSTFPYRIKRSRNQGEKWSTGFRR